jgi:hypothetical protein
MGLRENLPQQLAPAANYLEAIKIWVLEFQDY